MRNLIPLFTVALFLFGCAKDEINPSSHSTPSMTTEDESAFVLTLEDGIPTWTLVTIEEKSNAQHTSSVVTTRSNNGGTAHTHGDFPGVEFSGTQNNGGTHGAATANFGPLTMSMETECVMVDGQEAVYGGTITEMAGPTPPGFPFGVGDYMYFKVIDNGEGNNAPADQFVGAIRLKKNPNSRCGIWVPSHASWSNFPIFDIPDPLSVKVNN